MREGWPSLTALAVAVARGIGTADDNVDPSAAGLVPPALGRALAWIGRPGGSVAVRSTLRAATLGMVDHVSLRRAAIDEALSGAIEAGTRQLVVLGAGLDGRAWRLASLRDVEVFEVDHPATQRGKQARVQGRPTHAAAVHFVAVDFERDALAERLAEAGHDPHRPTAWIWEGVTPYLFSEAIDASLDDVAARSAHGSRLIVSYAIPRLMPVDIPGLDALTEAGFSALGEPLRGAMETEDLVARLASRGFATREDSGNDDWAQRHPGSARLARLFHAERLMVAERLGDAPPLA
ncbi:MAG: SAM-dependent methyltransferase [Deltaproteobacteria bacterium]|nr:SAM-dependent methyltransferase [Deltaproteobacteria bacterium]